mmetsp:Transcript_63153/g.186628  ORF Transcript_63153/g.186628 Transcript_63153/m.186628 type:complete len:333 (-) Transcript_63153:926-1924(-)
MALFSSLPTSSHSLSLSSTNSSPSMLSSLISSSSFLVSFLASLSESKVTSTSPSTPGMSSTTLFSDSSLGVAALAGNSISGCCFLSSLSMTDLTSEATVLATLEAFNAASIAAAMPLETESVLAERAEPAAAIPAEWVASAAVSACFSISEATTEATAPRTSEKSPEPAAAEEKEPATLRQEAAASSSGGAALSLSSSSLVSFLYSLLSASASASTSATPTAFAFCMLRRTASCSSLSVSSFFCSTAFWVVSANLCCAGGTGQCRPIRTWRRRSWSDPWQRLLRPQRIRPPRENRRDQRGCITRSRSSSWVTKCFRSKASTEGSLKHPWHTS